MAILLTAWEDDNGKGQKELAHSRSDQPWYDLDEFVKAYSQDPDCVLITKGRTDNQSLVEHILWQKPGYVDPTLM